MCQGYFFSRWIYQFVWQVFKISASSFIALYDRNSHMCLFLKTWYLYHLTMICILFHVNHDVWTNNIFIKLTWVACEGNRVILTLVKNCPLSCFLQNFTLCYFSIFHKACNLYNINFREIIRVFIYTETSSND